MPVKALVVLQQASLPIDTQYDTNPRLTAKKQSIWRYSVTPTYSIAAVEDQDRWYTNASLRVQRTSDKNLIADREDPNVDIGWQRELERGNFSLLAHYDKRSSLLTEFERTGLVDVDGSAINKSISANWSRLLTERMNLSVSTQYLKTTYDGSGFFDSTTKNLSSTLSYDWSETISPFVQFSYTDFKPEGAGALSNKSKNLLLGSKFLINPNWTFSPSAGVNKVSTFGSGWVSNNNLSYIGEKSNFEGSLSRSVSPSGLGSFQKTDSLNLSYTYALSDISKWGASYGVVKSKSLLDFESTRFSTWYSYDLTALWQMRLLLETRNQKNVNLEADGEIIGLTFTYNTPEF